MTVEHIALAMAFDVPIIIVVTKIDIASPYQIEKTITDLHSVLTQPGHKKVREKVSSS